MARKAKLRYEFDPGVPEENKKITKYAAEKIAESVVEQFLEVVRTPEFQQAFKEWKESEEYENFVRAAGGIERVAGIRLHETC